MATTARGIVYPTVGTTLTPLANHFASLATSTNTALDNLDNGLMRYAGLDSARAALTAPKLKEGVQWYSTDTDRTWFYDGSNWLSSDPAQYIVRPTSVVNGTIQADGTITATGGQNVISFNGVFSSRFRKYVVDFNINMPASNFFVVRLRNAGADYSSLQYNTEAIEAAGSGTAQATLNAALDYFPPINASNRTHWGRIEFTLPGLAVPSMMKTMLATIGSGQGGTPGSTLKTCRVETTEANTYDGFTLYVPGAATTFNSGSWFKIYGIA